MDLAGSEFQSVLDVNSLLVLSAAGDNMKDDRESKRMWTRNSLYSVIGSISEAQAFGSKLALIQHFDSELQDETESYIYTLVVNLHQNMLIFIFLVAAVDLIDELMSADGKNLNYYNNNTCIYY